MMPTEDQTPVLDTLTEMNAVSLVHAGPDTHALILQRIAALAAVDARPISYLLHVGPAVEAGVTAEEVQQMLVAIAPIIGTARTMSAAINITEALGFAIAAVADDATTQTH
jgi:alkylhydroperoxidase/carboxymuconolactone decarboxylase family protein YurZ